MTVTLFHTPGACSRVTMGALEETGVAFEDVVINFRTDAQHSAAYLEVNPKGKVPALRVDGAVLTENPAILWYLHSEHPSAGLLPTSASALAAARQQADLAWCASGLHPLVRQIRAPHRWTNIDGDALRADGTAKFSHECERIAARLADGRWWCGAAWSILDVYIYWMYSTAASGGFPLGSFPVLLDHAERVRARPSFQRVIARERAALEREGMGLPPGMSL